MKTVIFFLFVFTFAYSYDFEDEVYNDLLKQQLSISNPRARRATTNNCVDQASCCNDEALQNYHSQDRNTAQQCYKELNIRPGGFDGPLTDEQKNNIKCVVECIGKKKGYLDTNGKLLKDKLLNNIKENLQSVTWLVPKLNGLYDRCLENLENAPTQANQCNDIGITVGHCIWKEIQLECPTEKQANPEKCADLKEYLRNNNRFPPPPPTKC